MPEASVFFIIFASISLMTGGMLACVWLWFGRAPYLAAWAGANFAIALARLIFAAVDQLPGLVVTMLGGAALLMAASLLWAGGRLLRGADTPVLLLAAPGLLWCLAFLVPGFQASAFLQLLASALTAASLCLLFATDMLRLPRAGLARLLAVFIAAMASLYALSHLARLLAPPGASSFAITAPNIFVGGPLFIAIGFLALALAHLERAESEARIQRNAQLREAELLAATARREALAQRAGREEMERLNHALPAGIFHGYRKADGSIGRLYRGGDLPAVLGWSRKDLARMDTLEAISDFGGTSLPELVAKVLREGSGVWDWRLRQPDGTWAWMRTHARRLEDSEIEGGEFVGYTFDIGREREAEARALVAARLASLGELAAGLAHELRQPLQSISLGAEIAQLTARRLGAEELERRLEQVVTEARHASLLMDHLRRFARGTSEEAKIEEVRLDLAIQDALALAGDALRRAGITFETAFDQPPPRVRGQGMAVEQILANLLLLARDALLDRPAGVARHLRIEARAEPDGAARIVITDPTGGVPATAMARLAAAPVMMKGPDASMGLGISICLGLVRAMNGTLIASHDAAGATFTVTLPMVPALTTSA